jgi:hypothetical protein
VVKNTLAARGFGMSKNCVILPLVLVTSFLVTSTRGEYVVYASQTPSPFLSWEIFTDGTLGTLTPENLRGWSFQRYAYAGLPASSGSYYSDGPLDPSYVYLTPGALVAIADELIIRYPDPETGVYQDGNLLIFGNDSNQFGFPVSSPPGGGGFTLGLYYPLPNFFSLYQHIESGGFATVGSVDSRGFRAEGWRIGSVVTPEPSSFITWSALGAIAAVIASSRKRRAA